MNVAQIPTAGDRGPDRSPLLATAGMVVLVLLQSAYALYRPAPDNDLLFYAATVHQWEGLDPAAIHAASYADIRAFLAPDVYDRMVSENDYMRAVTADPEALVQQIPFYSVKPLFPAMLLVLDRIGFPVGLGAILIAIVAYAALSLLAFFWFRRHLGPWWSLALAGLLTLSPPFSALPSLESPDALGALFTVAGLFVLVEMRRVDAAMAIFLLAILARPNAVIAEVTLAAALVVLGRSSPTSLSPARGAAWMAAGIALVFGLSLLSRNYGVATLFYFSVVEYLPYPAAGPPPLALTEVLRLYAFRLVNLVVSPIPLFAFIGVLAIRVRASTLRMIRSDPIAMIILATFAAIALGWLYYPNEPERILVGGFLSCALLLVVAVARALNGVPDLALDSRVAARSDRLVGAGSINTSDGSAVAASVVPPGGASRA